MMTSEPAFPGEGTPKHWMMRRNPSLRHSFSSPDNSFSSRDSLSPAQLRSDQLPWFDEMDTSYPANPGISCASPYTGTLKQADVAPTLDAFNMMSIHSPPSQTSSMDVSETRVQNVMDTAPYPTPPVKQRRRVTDFGPSPLSIPNTPNKKTRHSIGNLSETKQALFKLPKVKSLPEDKVDSPSPETPTDGEKLPIKNNIDSTESVTKQATNKKKSRICSCRFLSVIFLVIAVCVGYYVISNTPECHEVWSSTGTIDIKSLEKDLHDKVFGQHIALDMIPDLLQSYLSDTNNTLPLVLSFHGWTGIGKNYISNFITENSGKAILMKIIIPLHFPHADSKPEEIQRLIVTNIRPCKLHIVLIDEVDKASPTLLEGIKNALQQLHDSPPRKSKLILLLLTNAGGTAINKYVLSQLVHNRARESITHEELLPALLDDGKITPGDTWYSALYQKGLIHSLVPFLPLERKHVGQCVEEYLTARDVQSSPEIIAEVLNELKFFPKDTPLFSTTGCRKVPTKTDLVLA